MTPPVAEPPPPDRPITASVTVSGTDAAVLRDLAEVLVRTPEALALEYVAGLLKIPAEAIGADPEFAEWGLFDGPSDLAESADEHLRQGFGR